MSNELIGVFEPNKLEVNVEIIGAGPPGTSFKIKGLFPTLEDLIDAHPQGVSGDAYAVGTESQNVIYIWSEDQTTWVNIGSVQGPPGSDAEVTEANIEAALGYTPADEQDLASHLAETVQRIGGVHGLEIEAGNWTPEFRVAAGTNGEHTYSRQEGTYLKIGKLVFVRCWLTMTTKDPAMSGYYLGITELPFIAYGNTAMTLCAQSNFVMPSGGTTLTAVVEHDTNRATLINADNVGGWTNLQSDNLTATSELIMSGCYMTI